MLTTRLGLASCRCRGAHKAICKCRDLHHAWPRSKRPDHFKMDGGGLICGLCKSKNPLGNLRKMSLREVTEASEFIVAFTRSGEAAHALHIDGNAVLGPWIKFSSGETLERALKYLGCNR